MSSIYSNLPAHVAGYAGHAQISTLIFLLDKTNCPPSAELQVVSMLEKLCKQQRHTILYSKLMHEYSGNSAISALFEKQWPLEQDVENRKEYSALEQQLSEKRNHALKEEERMCLVRLTQFHHTKGDLDAALRTCGEWFTKCQSHQHKFECSLKAIELLIEQRNFGGLFERISQANLSLKDASSNSKTWATANMKSRLSLAEGLHHLNSSNFKEAARCFCGISKGALASLTDICSMSDIATLGAICGLASFDRKEIKSKLLEHPDFTEILENAPAIHSVITAFHNIDYQIGLQQFLQMQPDLSLNPFITSHLPHLMNDIQELAISQYVVPFVSVRLQALATTFNMSVPDVEKMLCNLIERHKVAARIDSVDKLLVARDIDQRDKTLKDITAAAEARVRVARGRVVAANVARVCQLQLPR